MKNQLFYYLLCCVMFVNAQQFEDELSYETTTSAVKQSVSQLSTRNNVENSILSSGQWYKFAIDNTGVFKLNKAFFIELGVDINTIDPRNIRVYGNGGGVLPENMSGFRYDDLQENAIEVSGENDGRFDDDDFVLLYGRGPIKWDLSSRNNIKHTQNVYDSLAYYFINVDLGIGKRISNVNLSTGLPMDNITSFTDYQLYEEDVFNYVKLGRHWFSEEFTDNKEVKFNFKNIITTEKAIANFAIGSSSLSNTTVNVEYNNSNIFSLNLNKIGSSAKFSYSNRTKAEFSLLNDQIDLNIKWNNLGDLSSSARIDYIELICDRNLIANDKQFQFFNYKSQTIGNVLNYQLDNIDSNHAVWDVTDHLNPKKVNINTTTPSFKILSDGALDVYQLIDTRDYYTPIQLENRIIENQNLHDLNNIQYIVITNHNLLNQGQRIANYHNLNTSISKTNKSTLNTVVVDVEQIYNEFSSGSKDVTAIRDFLKFIYDKGTSEQDRLKFVCFLGDATYDYKEIEISINGDDIPVYLSEDSSSLVTSYNTDDYYAQLDANDSSGIEGVLKNDVYLDIITGRIPISEIKTVTKYIDKLLNYYSDNTKGGWKNTVTLLGDDGQEGSDQSLIRNLDNSALIAEKNAPNLNFIKLYTDAFKEEVTSGGGRYPEIVKRFNESFNNGSLIINYFGHGNELGLGQEDFMNLASIRSFRNLNNLPLFITVTCDFSRFDNPFLLTAGEELFSSEQGGAIAMITTTREIKINTGVRINNELADYLYEEVGGEFRTVGEALRDTKNDSNIRDFNEFFVFLFGDPAMKLSRPESGIIIDKLEEEIIDDTSGEVKFKDVNQIKGLSKIRLKGRVTEPNNENKLIENYNGELTMTLFDQPIKRKTLLNEGSGAVVEFESLENKVFVGKSTVENGQFDIEFIVPKDLTFTPGEAKFSFYATSDIGERSGSDFNYTIGGLSDNIIEDNEPPVVEVFLDDLTFTDGNTTTSSPQLIVKTTDDSGINTSLNSIGHNISLVIDNDQVNPIVLNEFYAAEKDDFTKGNVSFELPELKAGIHNIELKVWDTHNNLTKTNVSFVVEDTTKFKITNILNYPNPFISNTEFWFKNNKIGDPLEIKVQIYTVSGKLVRSIFTFDQNTDGFSRTTTWDGTDDFGNKLAKGVYLYKLEVKNTVSLKTAKKVEKLVIL